jgi:hypothetical protein
MPDFQMFLTIMAHRRFRWNACAHLNGEWQVIQASSRYTLVDAGPREIERLDCEVVAGNVLCAKQVDTEISVEKLRSALGTKRCAGIPGGT